MYIHKTINCSEQHNNYSQWTSNCSYQIRGATGKKVHSHVIVSLNNLNLAQ